MESSLRLDLKLPTRQYGNQSIIPAVTITLDNVEAISDEFKDDFPELEGMGPFRKVLTLTRKLALAQLLAAREEIHDAAVAFESRTGTDFFEEVD